MLFLQIFLPFIVDVRQMNIRHDEIGKQAQGKSMDRRIIILNVYHKAWPYETIPLRAFYFRLLIWITFLINFRNLVYSIKLKEFWLKLTKQQQPNRPKRRKQNKILIDIDEHLCFRNLEQPIIEVQQKYYSSKTQQLNNIKHE